MQIADLPLKGLKLITPDVFKDERGLFFQNFSPEYNLGSFVQDNVSFSKKGTIRALHFQAEPGQAKLVSCLSGCIWDVAVDLRPDSKTFLQHFAVELDAEKRCQLFIPVGFAHGFCALQDALVFYKVSSAYNPATEKSIRWNDPTLQIPWPNLEPILSLRDQNSPFIQEALGALDHRR